LALPDAVIPFHGHPPKSGYDVLSTSKKIRQPNSKGLTMRWFGVVIGVVLVLIGAISFAAPGLLLALGRSVITPTGLYAIAALRIVIGLGFVFAAPVSRTPRLIRVLGVIVIIAGLSTPWFGVTRARAVMDWWASAGPLLMRVDAVVGIAIGGFLLYVFRAQTRRAA
jgi:hypothetical protein